MQPVTIGTIFGKLEHEISAWPQSFKERITLSSGLVAIQQIKCIGWGTFYWLDSDLSTG